MNRFELSVLIDQPLDAVWQYLNTPENELVWQSSAEDRILVGDLPVQKGTRMRDVDRFLGRRLKTVWEVAELHDYEKRERTVESPFDMEIDWRLEPEGDGTRLHMTMVGQTGLGGVFGRLSDSIVTRIGKREWQANLDTLKDILEAQ